jgi:transglutaminase-like putative cysteine protease
MGFSTLHKWVTYLLSGLGLLALSLGSELSESTQVLMFVGFLLSFFAEEELHARRYYSTVWTASVVAFLAVQIARGLTAEPTLSLAIEFAAFLQISRLFNRRTAADYQQIAVLAFLHLTAATVLSTNLSYAAIFIGFVIATPWMLALSHLRREIEANYPAPTTEDSGAQQALRRVLASKRVVGAGFLAGTALLSLPLFAMTLLIFVTIPRVGQGFLSFERGTGQRVAGFGNEIELGGFGVIRDDPTVVLRVLPLPRVDEKAPRISLRLRGTSFDNYDGKRWTRAPSLATRLERVAATLYPLRREPTASDRELKIILDHLDEAVVFLPEGTVALSVPPRLVNGRAEARELTHAPGLDVRYEHADGMGLIYSAFVSRDPAEADLVTIDEERRADYLRVPPNHERIRELARRVVGDATSVEEKADRIERFLQNAPYSYSLRQPDVGKKPPLIAFLFDAKRGHCEYFASAMAIMLRTIDIPARNVTGFAGGQYNPYGGYYALRQGDAHSWVEAYVRGRGWVTYDPTPTSRSEAGPQQNLWSDVSAMIDAMRTRWMTGVVGYDLQVQVGFLKKLARMLAERRAQQDQTPGTATGSGAFFLALVKGSLRWIAFSVVMATLMWLIWRLFVQPDPSTTRVLSKPEARAVSLYTELERALAKRGHPRPPAFTPLEHADKLKAQGFAEHAEVQIVTDHYLEARYGGRPLRSTEVKALREAINRIRRAA